MKLKQLSKNKEIILLILSGFALRFYKLKERFSWGPEQSIAAWPMIKLFEEKKLTLIGIHMSTYKSALFRPPFFTYLFALPLKMFNFNPLILEYLFTFISLFSIFFVYLSAKRIYNKNTAIISSLLYAVSFNIINFDKNTWVVTPIIITSILTLFFLTKLFNKSVSRSLFLLIIGCFVGLGFSFHFQTAIILTTLSLIFLKKYGYKKTLFFLAGVILFLSPLIIFNLRHNFIMLKGLKHLVSGNETIIRGDPTFLARLNNGIGAFSDLSLLILNLSFIKKGPLNNFLLFILLFLLPCFYLKRRLCSQKERMLINYFLFSSLLALTALMVINQVGYSSIAFYLWFLIPSFLIIWGRVLFLLFKKNKIIAILIISYIALTNLNSFRKQQPGNYQNKIAIVDYILEQAQEKKFSLKFINEGVLAYDFLFYYRAPFYNLSFNDINLIEQWQEGKPDFYLVHRDYDLEKDKLKIQPLKKIVNFKEIKIIVK